jgi:hypothetical protein
LLASANSKVRLPSRRRRLLEDMVVVGLAVVCMVLMV